VSLRWADESFYDSKRTMPGQDETGRIVPRWAPESGSLLGRGHEKAGVVVVVGRKTNKLGRWCEEETVGRVLRGVAPGGLESMADLDLSEARRERRNEVGQDEILRRGRGWDENRKGRSDRW
jgi:hypothetical protein